MDNTLYDWDFTKIEDNFINYIIPFVEKNYNVSTKVEDRALCGLSAGGMTTNVMFFDHPEVFKYYGMFSGCFTSLGKLTEGQDKTRLMIVAGTCDVGSTTIDKDPGPGLKYEFVKNWLADNNFNNYKDYGLIPGGHDWFTWSKSLYLFGTEVAFSEENTSTDNPKKDEPSKEPTIKKDETVKADTKKEETKKNNSSVKTGNHTSIALFATMMIISGCVVASTFTRRKRNN